ncbi:hypothetical protein Ancab_011835 [Ancistrocladus abbreviatus]
MVLSNFTSAAVEEGEEVGSLAIVRAQRCGLMVKFVEQDMVSLSSNRVMESENQKLKITAQATFILLVEQCQL